MNLKLHNIELTLEDFHLHVDLNLPPGELISLLGPSGCGKTTLLKIISGLYTPSKGKVFLGERDITGLEPRYRKIGMVFQDYALFPHMNVVRNVCYGMKEKGPEARKKAEELLAMVHLEGYGRRKPDELSGGEKQRVALARALAGSPEILLLDEPLSALDAKLRRSLRRQIREIQIETGLTAVYVTHDQEEAMAISDRIVLMDSGRVRQIGTPEELYERPADRFCGSFIGTSNSIPLKSLHREGPESLIASTDRGDFHLSPDQMGAESPSPEYLYFRPEDCLIGGEVKDTARKDSGEVVYREFGGDYQYLEVRCGEGIISIKCSSRRIWKMGEKVEWSVSRSRCLLI